MRIHSRLILQQARHQSQPAQYQEDSELIFLYCIQVKFDETLRLCCKLCTQIKLNELGTCTRTTVKGCEDTGLLYRIPVN